MSDQPATRKGPARSPFAGCTILIVAMVVLLFVVGFSIYSLVRQSGEIEKFTSTTAKPVPVAEIDGHEAAVNSLAVRLEAFRHSIDADPANEATLSLSADDINLAIAAYEPFKDLRETFHVREIRDGKILADISFHLNGRPRRARADEPGIVTADPRYLNGSLVARPDLGQGEVFLRIESLDIPGATVPQPFFEQFSLYRICERYTKDPVLGPAMKKLTGLDAAGTTITLRHRPGEAAPESMTKAQVDAAGSRFFTFLGFAACVFLVFAGLIVFASLRRKARENNSTP
jgi:hypothetical protein